MSYTFTLLDGKKLHEEIIQKIKIEIAKLNKKPVLSVILVGEDPASAIYVKKKNEVACNIGIESRIHKFDKNISYEKLLEFINSLNNDKNVTAILVQLPLPEHIDKEKVIESILPQKDADGFHPYNMGRLFAGLDTIEPCTPKGIIELLKRYNITIQGREVVIIGRSNIVGKPLFHLMIRENATVTICHSKTNNLKDVCKRADILVAAIGRPRMINKDFVKDGACVIDVGMNRLNGKLCGDVDYDEVIEKVKFITPVPGGVGPMTVAMLMKNTLELYKCQSTFCE
ncbi:MAG: bifunctional methylenetetrahydrofolate dehydrogenase/methenyltetrahydrofolate cyclohydrolase FolD [Candidatus Hydrogenedentota bacterium]